MFLQKDVLNLFTTNYVHECAEFQKIISCIFYASRCLERPFSPLLQTAFGFFQDKNKRGREIIKMITDISCGFFPTDTETF